MHVSEGDDRRARRATGFKSRGHDGSGSGERFIGHGWIEDSHIHYHILVTDGVFSTGSDGRAVFHPALDLDTRDFIAVQQKMRHRGLRWLHRHGHLDSVAIHTMDTPEHAGGWSVDASVHLPAWDRQGLERLVRYRARPPLSQERLGRLNAESLVYNLRKPTLDGCTELLLTPLSERECPEASLQNKSPPLVEHGSPG